MIVGIAEKMVNTFLKNQVIDKENTEAYKYGMELLVSQVISIGVVLILGILLGRMWETLLFLIFFIAIRVYAGGYHASCYRNCIMGFAISYIGILVIGEWMRKEQLEFLAIICLVFANIIIYILAPIEDRNKPLDSKEYIEYRKKAQKNTIFMSSIIYVVYAFIPLMRDKMFYAALAICEIGVLLLIGYVKNKKLLVR